MLSDGIVRTMATEQKEEFLTQTVALSVRIGGQISKRVPAVLGKHGPLLLQDLLLNSEATNQFTLLGLWQLLVKLNLKATKKADHLVKTAKKVGLILFFLTINKKIKLDQQAETYMDANTEEAKKQQNDLQKGTLKEAFMRAITSSFQDELEQLRQQVDDAASASLLVDALHTGVDIFDNDTELKGKLRWLQ